ncbi:cold shock domain-containing protein [Actinoplanes sp. TRM 88003]|uniref:Cold shock domain-containing protein n=1 Tax=Paractinoplanes aksuensis TaxID=2939490 RepID=A0ABT1DNV7_9ACTN|nr:cold shock domain-containing protein [Actinoplanes aksuensis]MCO8272528.1 cold shock domain-containing protein [Actinoplanes aksuensis]
MADPGTIRFFDDDEGWGVIDSEQCPGGCWAHFSAAAVAGAPHFTPGQPVLLEWEPAHQDGYAYRAVRFWPADSEPVDRPAESAPSAAYRSTLTLTFDPPEHADPQ